MALKEDIAFLKDLLAKGYKFTFEKEPVFRKIQPVSSLNLTWKSLIEFEGMELGEVRVLECCRKKNLRDHSDILQYIVKKRGDNWAAVAAGGAMKINIEAPKAGL